jgi:hypothetical protein
MRLAGAHLLTFLAGEQPDIDELPAYGGDAELPRPRREP